MQVTLAHDGGNHVQRGDHRSIPAVYDDYRGTVNGKEFSVRVDPMQAPAWRGQELNEDEQAAVLAEIENN